MRLNSSCESLKLRSSLYIKPLSRQRDCVRPMLARSCRQKAAASHRSRKWLFIRASSVGATLTQPSLQEEPVDSSRSWVPSGDQPSAIRNIVTALKRGDSNTLLRGATGTGKTFVMSNVIRELERPTLILCPNKTLAAQVVRELGALLPTSAVELFVSHFSTYIPEAFHASSGTFIPKTSVVNEQLEAMRHRATRSLFERRDVVIVASVSCLYGLGMPEEYARSRMHLRCGNPVGGAEGLAADLRRVLYRDPEPPFDTQPVIKRGELKEAATSVLFWPPQEPWPICATTDAAGSLISIEYVAEAAAPSAVAVADSAQVAGGAAAAAAAAGPVLTAAAADTARMSVAQLVVYPAKHYVTSEERLKLACGSIREELRERAAALRESGNEVAASRIEQRTFSDLRDIEKFSFCSGMENYSRHLSGRAPCAPPTTLLDYLRLSGQALNDMSGGGGGGVSGATGGVLGALGEAEVDESHVTLPQLRAMAAGDASRKVSLVENGFRLPSAVDNRPLREEEFWSLVPQAVLVSATPGAKELALVGGVLDPLIEVAPTHGQLADLLGRVRVRCARGERTLVSAPSKRDAEDVSAWLMSQGIRSGWLHSALDATERAAVLAKLQGGELEILVGVNLLREGLDLPEVSLVAVLGADKEGFLRSSRSLIQLVGRAARHVDGAAVLYGDRVTPAMRECLDVSADRRRQQAEHNQRTGLTPRSTRGAASQSSLFALRTDEIQQEVAFMQASYALAGAAAAAARKVVEEEEEREGIARGADEAEASTSAAAPAAAPGAKKQRKDRDLPGGPGGSSLGEERAAALRAFAEAMPRRAGVYIWKTAPGDKGAVLYVGKANNLRSRVSSYLAAAAPARARAMVEEAGAVDFVLTPGGERDALLLEARLISHYQPPYNVRLRHDKHFPYIAITPGGGAGSGGRAAVPMVAVVSGSRSVAAARAGARSFGPFPQGREASRVLAGLDRVLSLRELRVQASYGNDPAPYLEAVELAAAVLGGGASAVAARLDASGRASAAADLRGLFLGSVPLASRFALDPWLVQGASADPTDVAAVAFEKAPTSSGRNIQIEASAVVVVIQLRAGVGVAGRFVYPMTLPGGFRGHGDTESEREAVIGALLQHYSSAAGGAGDIAEEGAALVGATVLPASLPAQLVLPCSIPPRSALRKLLESSAPSMGREGASAAEGADSDAQKPRSVRFRKSADSAADRALVRLALENARAELSHSAEREVFVSSGAAGLQQLLGLSEPVRRVEAFDIAHLGGEAAVASHVVFIDGRPAPERHRSVPVRPRVPGDDIESIEQAVFERFCRPGATIPDVLLIDGGKAQLAAAAKALRRAGVPFRSGDSAPGSLSGVPYDDVQEAGAVALCSLAKRLESVFVPGRPEPLDAGAGHPGVLLLRAVRDEAHRVANSAHRQLRRKGLMMQS